VIPLSFAQERLWFIHQHMRGYETTYNLPIVLRLSGILDVAALRAAIAGLVARHESLRTTFTLRDDGIHSGEPMQVIAEALALQMPIVDVPSTEVSRHIQTHVQHVFDLRNGPLLKLTLLRLGPDEQVLLLSMHHVISDGWSMTVMLQELRDLYAIQVSGGEQHRLAPLPIQYADYACWQRHQDLSGHLRYWTSALRGYEPGLTLPYDAAALPNRARRAKWVRHAYPLDLAEQVARFSGTQASTLFMTLLAALFVVLERYTGRTDLCIGTTVAGRDSLELEGLIGNFVNILPLRVDLTGDPTAAELVQRVKRVALDAYEHEQLPFERLLNALRLPRDGDTTPLVPVMARHQNYPESPAQSWAGGLRMQPVPPTEDWSVASKSELDLQFYGTGPELGVVVEYAADLFQSGTIERLLQHHTRVLEQMVADSTAPVSRLAIMTSIEQSRMLVEWNATQCAFPSLVSVPELFEQRVAAHPDAIACIGEEGPLCYAALNASANRVAHALRARHVLPEVRVGVYLERSAQFLACLLGILKAGGVYVPLDPDYPASYLRHILDNAQPRIVITDRALAPRLGSTQAVLLELETLAGYPTHDLQAVLSPEHLAYIMYTSGSTGQPQGAMVPHRQMLNWLHAMWERMPFVPGEMVAQKTVAAFSISVKELLAGLLQGVPQVLIADETVRDAAALLAAIERWQVTRLNIVPSHLQHLLSALGEDTRSLASLKHLIISGEPWTQSLRALVKAKLPWVTLWNVHGCTELNDTTYCWPYEQDSATVFVPIGRPIANTRVYVLDRDLHLVPVGVPGELCVDSVGLTRGYCGQPGLTAQRFIANPFSQQPGARLYRTGDIVRYLGNGTLDYLGRADFEVKIRGRRIDVRQVEAALSTHPAVAQCLVRAWGTDTEGGQLAAYYTSRAFPGPTAADLRSYLTEHLPAYMVPVFYIALDRLPQLPNGKLDRKGLPAPDLSGLATALYVAPRNGIEKRLVEMWSELLVLPAERISIQDDFFSLGGHSLLAARLIARLRKEFHRELPYRLLFDGPTVQNLAAHVESTAFGRGAAVTAPILARPRAQKLPLSFGQQRLWFIHTHMPGQETTYNLPMVFTLRGPLELEALRGAFAVLVDRHESLRTSFQVPAGEEEPVQRIESQAALDIPLIEVPAEKVQHYVADHATHVFDLGLAPLLKVTVLRVTAVEHVLLINITTSSAMAGRWES